MKNKESEYHFEDGCYPDRDRESYSTDVKMNTAPRKYAGKIQDNYDEYLKKPIRIGFDHYPVVGVMDVIHVDDKCRGFDVSFTVKLVTVLCVGVECRAVVADLVDISSRLPLNGFGHLLQWSSSFLKFRVWFVLGN